VLLASTGCPTSGDAPATLDLASAPRVRPGVVAPPPSGSLEPVYIDADLAETYEIFVLRTLTPTEKSARWSHYYDGRWVRWCGELRFFTHDGIQMRQFASTEAYDVEIFMPEPQKSALRSQLTLGRFYNYTGRLDRYDESFRSLTLTQGTILHPDEFGVPSMLVASPEPIWKPGAPPRVLPMEGTDAGHGPPR
jgi:hypothetical protein